ncbi:MAG: hypothetical protein JWN98_305 [Abditibacteriota bacterium]|nr:hypothetical protein [Abditibacteriota bacterium]
MNFIAPQNFLFAGLLGVVLLLYILRLKRKERVMPSTMLWQTALRDLQANAPWQKLRSSLLMWLQLLFLSLAVLALVRPAIKVLSSGGQTIAIVLDASASMAASDVSPSRFERARGEATRLVNSLSSGDGATIIAAGAQTKVLSPLTADKNVLKRALSDARTQDTGANLREAIVLAASLLRGKKNSLIYVVSDGAVAPVADLSLGNTGVEFVRVGARNDNIAITAMDVRRGYGGGADPQIFVTLANFSNQPKTINLELSHNGELTAVRPVTVPKAQGETPGQQSQLFDDLDWDQGLFGVRFANKDDLASDNFAYAQLAPPQRLKVLLISNGNLFLEKALNIDPNVQLERATPGDFQTAKANNSYDVVVCDGVAPANLPTANLLMFNAIGESAPVQKNQSGVAVRPSVADWDRKHPVTRFAPWNDLRFAQSLSVSLKPWAQTLVEAERTPLVVAGERKLGEGRAQRVVWCGFDLRDTDLPLRVAFPIFITSSLHWLGQSGSGQTALNENNARRAGESVLLRPPSTLSQIAVSMPDKSTLKVPVQNGQALFDRADRAGLYTAEGKSGQTQWKQLFGVSLLNRSESNLRPRDAIQLGAGKPIEGATRARANRELWGYLTLAALLLLGLEWWVYHRGVG